MVLVDLPQCHESPICTASVGSQPVTSITAPPTSNPLSQQRPPFLPSPLQAPPVAVTAHTDSDTRQILNQETAAAPPAAKPYSQSPTQMAPSSPTSDSGQGSSSGQYASGSVPRLPPILQVEKKQVTTSATQAASASRRRNEAHFVCPVPDCGSTFTRRFNLRGHLRSHTEERPYVCDWPGCNKGFARQHDCKRHQSLHTSKSQSNMCPGCKKTFSRLDALNRHLRSEGGADCRQIVGAAAIRASENDDPEHHHDERNSNV